MGCEYCGRDTHDPRCPNYVLPKASEYCDICGEDIYSGEKYVENLNGDFIHYDCIDNFTIRELIQWLGHEIGTMNGE